MYPCQYTKYRPVEIPTYQLLCYSLLMSSPTQVPDIDASESKPSDLRAGNRVGITRHDYKLAAKLIASGMPIAKALRQAGYAETTAMLGVAALRNNRQLSKALEREQRKNLGALSSFGKGLDPSELRNAILGKLAFNIMDGSDDGVQSLKLAGSVREIAMWKDETQSQAIVIMPSLDPGVTETRPALCNGKGQLRVWSESGWRDGECAGCPACTIDTESPLPPTTVVGDSNTITTDVVASPKLLKGKDLVRTSGSPKRVPPRSTPRPPR